MKNSNILFIFLLIFMMFGQLTGQQTGEVNYEQLGISFTIPDGWVGQESNGVYLMGSNSVPGFILLMVQSYPDLEAMKKDLEAGYSEGIGTNLNPTSKLEDLGNDALGAVYSGTLEGQPAKGYIIGALNPHGQEVGIMAITTAQQYSEAQPNAAKAVWRSLKFSEIKTAPIAQQWKEKLSNVKLTYMDSYYSSSYTDGGISGGYETKNIFDLCGAGYFNYYGSDNMSAGGDFSSAYSSNSSRGSGTWDVLIDANGAPVLQLQFNNGQTWEYNIEMKEKEFYMNGKRYYRTWSGDYAPNCN